MYVYKALCHNVVDGDTVDLIIDLGFKIKVYQRIRLARVNTPERGQEGFREAKNRLMELILDKEVYLESEGQGKYGRWIGEIVSSVGLNVSDCLINEGLGLAYVSK